MKISIRLVLLFSFLAVIWGTFFLTTTSSQITSEQVLKDHSHVIMENIASYAMEQSQNYLSKAQRATELTKSLLRSQVLVQEDGRALENYFLEQLVSYPDISGIYLGTPEGDFFFVSRNDKYSPGGIRTKIISHEKSERQVRYVWRDAQRNLIAEEVDTIDSYDPRVRPWYQGAMAAKDIFWSDPYIFYTSQNPGITISGPTYNQEGQLSGIVGVDIEIDQLSTFISNLRIGDNGYAFMLNQNRDVVAFHDVEQLKFVETGGKASSRLVKIDEFQDKHSRAAFAALDVAQDKTSQILLNRTEYVSFEVDGENYQAMFTPFPDPQWPWIIGMYLPEDDYLGALKQNRINNYLITFAISVLASILILFIARSIARPVIGLRRYAEDISAGDFDLAKDHSLSRGWFKEVSETACRFDGLMVELDQTRKDQIKAEESLRRKEIEYTSLVENLKVGVFRINLEGEIINANPAFACMIGCSSVGELKKHNIASFFSNHDDRQQLRETLRVNRQVNNWELKFIPFGQQEPIWVSIFGLLREDSTDCYVEGMVEDITERKHSEEMLILSERMAAVGTMASGVAHEFNNIHTGVLGYAELGSQLEDIPESVRAYFKTIHSASLRARDLTENLLSCSSQRSSQKLPADLNMTTRESYALVERDFINDGVDIECDFGDIPYLLMDRAQVGQVVLN
ncbi:MAG: PAS domain S-box protein, partial [Desulfuromonadales bacterium]|nr:PAS domain S-box protein [Desulfuromonadales bacterium]